MQKKYPLISLYDAHSEKEIFGNPEIVSRMHALALALAKARLGAVGRVGSSITTTVLTTLNENNIPVVGLSPAATEREHEKAFRLPHVSFPLVFTGRGALGSDIMALTSSHGILVAGSDEESLVGVLSYVGDKGIPIGIFTEEDPNMVRLKIKKQHPHLLIHVFVSNDAQKVIQELASGMRRQHFANA